MRSNIRKSLSELIPEIFEPKIHFRRAIKSIKSVKSDSLISNKRNRERKFAIMKIDALVKAFTIPISLSLKSHSTILTDRHPLEKALIDVVLAAREKKGLPSVEDIQLKSKAFVKELRLVGAHYTDLCKESTSAADILQAFDLCTSHFSAVFAYDLSFTKKDHTSIKPIVSDGQIISLPASKKYLDQNALRKPNNLIESNEKYNSKLLIPNDYVKKVSLIRDLKKEDQNLLSGVDRLALPDGKAGDIVQYREKSGSFVPYLPNRSLYFNVALAGELAVQETAHKSDLSAIPSVSVLYDLMEFHKELRRIPVIDLSLHTILVMGLPNVGKSSLVRNISTALPEVNNFSFTTRDLFIGKLFPSLLSNSIGKQDVQVIDSPGISYKPNVLGALETSFTNSYEGVSIAALSHLPIDKLVVLFVMDFSWADSRDMLNEQLLLRSLLRSALYNRVQAEGLSTIPWVDVITKQDLGTLNDSDRALVEEYNSKRGEILASDSMYTHHELIVDNVLPFSSSDPQRYLELFPSLIEKYLKSRK